MTPPAPVATQAPRILVVDDEPQIRDILAATLRRDGFQVTSRGAPKEALRDLESGAFELLVTDLKMPEMSGLELIKAAKRVAPDIRTCIATVASLAYPRPCEASSTP